jgi:hypothetical protein
MRLASLTAMALTAALLLSTLVTPRMAAAQTVSEPSPIELAYLADTKAFRERLGAYQEQLMAHQLAAIEGQLDTVRMGDLSFLSRELFTARQVFRDAIPSTRLDQYDRTVKLAIDRAYEATILLIKAQVTESATDREALIRAAGEQSHSSSRLLRDAADELRMAISVVAL